MVTKKRNSNSLWHSPGAVYYWFNRKVKPAFREILENAQPGLEGKKESQIEPAEKETGRAEACYQHGNARIWKNGTYLVINWLWLEYRLVGGTESDHSTMAMAEKIKVLTWKQSADWMLKILNGHHVYKTL